MMEECVEDGSYPDLEFTPGMIVTTLILITIILIVLVGNSLVITAVIKTRKLRTVTNIFIVSLACSDLLLGVCVLPFSTALEVLDYWPFGDLWCSVWLTIDVLLCTASILNLCAISLDRFLAVTRPIKYHSLMSKRRGRYLVSFVWLLSFLISFPPLIGWNDDRMKISFQNVNDVAKLQSVKNESGSTSQTNITEIINTITQSMACLQPFPQCELTSTHGYRIYASMGSFYIPMIIMVSFNCRIYLAAVRTVSSLRSGVLTSKRNSELTKNKCTESEIITLRVHRGGATVPRPRSPTAVSKRRGSLYSYHDVYISRRGGKQDSVRRKVQRHLTGNGRAFCHNLQEQSSKYHEISLQNGKKDPGECVPCISITCESSMMDKNGSCNESPYMKRKTPQCITTPIYGGRHRSMIFISDGRSSQKQHIRKIIRETKAAKTVAIIIGVFIFCWLPFFIIYLIGAFCDDCTPPLVFSILFWLGYCNSMFNPFIYGMFSKDFRKAFRRILYCRVFGSSTLCGGQREPYRRQKHLLSLPMLDSESFSDFQENTV